MRWGASTHTAPARRARSRHESIRESYFDAAAYGRHGVAVATARAGNVIGGGDWGTDRLIPDIVQAHSRQEEPCRSGNRTHDARGSTYSSPCPDTCDWQSGSTRRPGIRRRMEFRPGPRRPAVSWIVDQAASLWGQGAPWEGDAAAHPPEADCSASTAPRRTPSWDGSRGCLSQNAPCK